MSPRFSTNNIMYTGLRDAKPLRQDVSIIAFFIQLANNLYGLVSKLARVASFPGFAKLRHSTFFNSISNVVFLGSGKQMGGVNARFIVTGVTNKKPLGNNSINKLITKPVRFNVLTSQSKASVAVGKLSCTPNPTRICLINLIPKSFHLSMLVVLKGEVKCLH